MSETKRELEEVLKAIEGSGGVKVLIAKRLGVTRQTVDNYLDRWATARNAYADEEEGVTDIAQSIIEGNLKAAHNLQSESAQRKDWKAAIVDSADAKWWLTRKGKARGFVERNEITGADGGEVTIRIVDDR